jgi:hypothetical protein
MKQFLEVIAWAFGISLITFLLIVGAAVCSQ